MGCITGLEGGGAGVLRTMLVLLIPPVVMPPLAVACVDDVRPLVIDAAGVTVIAVVVLVPVRVAPPRRTTLMVAVIITEGEGRWMRVGTCIIHVEPESRDGRRCDTAKSKMTLNVTIWIVCAIRGHTFMLIMLRPMFVRSAMCGIAPWSVQAAMSGAVADKKGTAPRV